MEGRTMPRPNRKGREETEGRREKTPTEASNWDRVVDLFHTVFGEGQLADDAMWQEMVLVSKGGNNYRGIGLVEVM